MSPNGKDTQELTQKDMFPETRSGQPDPENEGEVQGKQKRTASMFQKAADIVHLRRDNLYSEPTEAVDLDGKTIDPRKSSDDTRPVQIIPPQQARAPATTPAIVSNLAYKIETNTLGEHKRTSSSTHSVIRHRKDATKPLPGDDYYLEGRIRMAEILKNILQKKKGK